MFLSCSCHQTLKVLVLAKNIPKIIPHAKSQPLTVTKLARPITYHPTTSTLEKGSQGNPQSHEYISVHIGRGQTAAYCYRDRQQKCLMKQRLTDIAIKS